MVNCCWKQPPLGLPSFSVFLGLEYQFFELSLLVNAFSLSAISLASSSRICLFIICIYLPLLYNLQICKFLELNPSLWYLRLKQAICKTNNQRWNNDWNRVVKKILSALIYLNLKQEFDNIISLLLITADKEMWLKLFMQDDWSKNAEKWKQDPTAKIAW